MATCRRARVKANLELERLAPDDGEASLCVHWLRVLLQVACFESLRRIPLTQRRRGAEIAERRRKGMIRSPNRKRSAHFSPSSSAPLRLCASALKGVVVGVLLTAASFPIRAAELPQTDVFTAGQDGYHTYRIPALVVTPKGALLAICEGRKTGRGD